MAMNLVGGKYKCIILYHLSGGAKRTRDLLLLLEGISSKVLTEQLRQLEEDGLIERTVICGSTAKSGIHAKHGRANISTGATTHV